MTALMVVTVTALCRKVEGVAQNHVEILVHQLATVYGHYGHKVSYLMHAEAEGSVLDQISEGVFHLVSVGKNKRALDDALIFVIIINSTVQK